MASNSKYNDQQLFLLWFLTQLQRIPERRMGPYYVDQIFEAANFPLRINSEEVQQLMDDELTIGHTSTPMLAAISKIGYAFVFDNSDLFDDFKRRYHEHLAGIDYRNFIRLKHALSASANDEGLTNEGFSLQGICGYLQANGGLGLVELKQVYNYDFEDYMTVTDESREKLGTFKFEYRSPLGYLSKHEEADTIKIERFFWRNARQRNLWDHLSVSNPKLDELSKLEYDAEEQHDAYVWIKPGEGRIPLYVYSTRPELLLFTPIPETTPKTDKTAPLRSDTDTEEDKLGRTLVVNHVVDLVDKMMKTGDHRDAYTILLDGEWGAGKSSMLNFFESQLHTLDWKVIRYNAWENQHFKEPWWMVINTISQKATDEKFEGDFHSHKYWRFKLLYKHKFVAAILIIVFISSVVMLFTKSDGTPNYSGLIGIITSFIAAIVGIVNNFFYKAISSDELKERFTGHPFDPVQKRFEEIAKENKLAIFIDDLDRCRPEPVVKLLESIQTLFKGHQVLYIVAADSRWLHECLNQEYKDLQGLKKPGATLSDQFLQKLIQLRVRVPGVKETLWKTYYESMIGVKKQIVSPNPQPNPQPDPLKPLPHPDHDLKEQRDRLEQDLEEELPKLLQKYHEFFKAWQNPRAVKLFINQYAVDANTRLVEGVDTAVEDKTVRYLLFASRYPDFARRLESGEITIQRGKLSLKNERNKKVPLDLPTPILTDIADILKDDINEEWIKKQALGS